jgi:hypothetical protein
MKIVKQKENKPLNKIKYLSIYKVKTENINKMQEYLKKVENGK